MKYKKPNLNTVKENLNQLTIIIQVIFNEFRAFFLILAAVFIVSCMDLYWCYPKEDLPAGHLTWLLTAYSTWLMIFFGNPLPFTDRWSVAPLFFLLPILGLAIIAEGVVHLGNLLFHHKRYSREWQKMIASVSENHVIVCGLGNIGVRVVEHLLRLGQKVIAIEHSKDARFIKEVEGYKVPVLIGDSRDGSTLENANVKRAKAIIAVTNDDLTNLETALIAREYKDDIKLVIRMFDQTLAKRIEKSFGVGAAYSSSARSSRLFAQAAISQNILDSFEFGGTVINAYQLIVNAKTMLIGTSIDEVRRQFEITVLLHEKNSGELDWNPAPTNILNDGDKLLIMTDGDGLERLEKLQLLAPVKSV